MNTTEIPTPAAAARIASLAVIPTSAARSRFTQWWVLCQALADYLSVSGGILTAYSLHRTLTAAGAVYSWSDVLLGATVAGSVALLVLHSLHLYDSTMSLLNIHEVENILRGITFLFLAAVVVSFFLHQPPGARWLVSVSAASVLVLLLIQRAFSLALVRWIHRRGYGVRKIVVYGTRYADRVVSVLARNPRLGSCCVGLLQDDNDEEQQPPNVRVLGTWNDLPALVAMDGLEEVIVADPALVRDKYPRLVNDCARLKLRLSSVPDLFGPYMDWFQYQLVDGLPLARCRHAAGSALDGAAKRILDLVVASAALLLTWPFMLAAAIAVKLDSRGPVFFPQNRVGKDGCLFRMWKFRSMHLESQPYERSPGDPRDPRITRVGRFIRRTSLDELPQLFNVLRGEMSLVGPRPEMPFIVSKYGPVERGRLCAKPGITGLWQISAARARPIHENIEYDLFYIEHQNIFLDCAILLYTPISVIRGMGAY